MNIIIETNVSMKDGIPVDHQSRIVEAKSWDDYVEYYKQNLEPDREHSKFESLTNLSGDSLPRYGDIIKFKYDDFHLSYYHIDRHGMITLGLAYLCEF